VVLDRLGSRRNPGGVRASYYPYGEERDAIVGDDRDKFATYWRDGFTGLDYARQRYYSSRSGRFLTADPYRASAALTNPQTWNRYAYVAGDPVNFVDPWGLIIEKVEWSSLTPISCVLWGAQYSGGLCYLYAARFLGEQRLTATQYGGDLRGVSKAGSKLGRRFVEIRKVLVRLKDGLAKWLVSGLVPKLCQDDLQRIGVGLFQLSQSLTAMQILSGVGSAVPLADILPPGLQRAKAAERNILVGHRFGPRSKTRAVAEWRGTRVWINPRDNRAGIGVDDYERNAALLLHEAMHNLGFTDVWIQRALSLDDSALSANISERLALNCF